MKKKITIMVALAVGLALLAPAILAGNPPGMIVRDDYPIMDHPWQDFQSIRLPNDENLPTGFDFAQEENLTMCRRLFIAVCPLLSIFDNSVVIFVGGSQYGHEKSKSGAAVSK
jgi:hypothetical protein